MEMHDCPLPGQTQQWSRSTIGPFKGWDDCLKAHATTLSSFTYPAAIFVGHDLTLLHNQAWLDAGGIDQQGCPQRGSLNSDIGGALSCILHDGRPMQIAARDLLRNDESSSKTEYLVLLSPLFDRYANATSVVAQLIPSTAISHSKNHRERGVLTAKRRPGIDGAREVGGRETTGHPPDDSIPLDGHPFFHRMVPPSFIRESIADMTIGFAEMLPSGLAILDHEAKAVFVNQHFYDLTTRKSDKSFISWPDSIHPDDKQRVLDAYQEAFRSQKQLRAEFRTLAHESHPWRLLLLTPLGDEDLRHVSLREYGGFICSIVDITSEKSAELAERKAAKEAEERKVVLTNFIDMVSHEIRNPLSAVLHCSEDISEAMLSEPPDIAAIEEAINTINICILHQKNIVDDVLSFSKLDASMLALVPSRCQPYRYLADSLKMFRPEFRKQNIDFAYRIDKSYPEVGVGWVTADMARISLVLINLVTNAIKFTTKTESQQKIRITVGASRDRPNSFPAGVVKFVDEDGSYRMDATNTKDWGRGEILYITVAVRDTGIGISPANQRALFGRFRQATPKTAERYGGSGLGLNIARKLCQLHGGEIAVRAKEGVGSTFAFFFKVVRAEPPQDHKTDTTKAGIYTVDSREQMDAFSNVSSENIDQNSPPSSPDYAPDSAEEELEDGQQSIQPGRQDDGENTDITITAAHPNGPRRSESTNDNRTLDTIDTPRGEKSSYSLSSPESGSSHKLHVLLVEDNVINQRLVSRKLEQRGFRVTTANNGREAVDAMTKARKLPAGDKGAFDIILMDNEMPVLDGNMATREIRHMETQGDSHHIPILGVTANARGAQQDEMISSGMDDVISKPYRISDMVEKIEKYTIASRKSSSKDETTEG